MYHQVPGREGVTDRALSESFTMESIARGCLCHVLIPSSNLPTDSSREVLCFSTSRILVIYVTSISLSLSLPFLPPSLACSHMHTYTLGYINWEQVDSGSLLLDTTEGDKDPERNDDILYKFSKTVSAFCLSTIAIAQCLSTPSSLTPVVCNGAW